jgi:phosphotriesterase-related protein
VIQTVLGPLPAAELGPTSMHEHLVIDARVLQAPAREGEPPAGERVTIENLGFVHWNLLALADNLVLDDPALATVELGYAAELGQRALVDLTSWGLGAQPAALPEIARASGMHVVAGCGVYLDRPHPDWIAGLSDEALAARFVAALEDELEDAGFRAGLLGIVGTGEPITASEQRVLWATAAAAGETGAALVVRLDPAARRGPEVLEILADAGCPPGQVIFGNADEFLDLGYLRELAAAGATLEWCFGNEAYYRDGYKDPTDAERLAALVELLADPSLAERCVLACSVWTKSQLRTFGGMGYEHLLRRIVPELRRQGVGDDLLQVMLVENPARLLDR